MKNENIAPNFENIRSLREDHDYKQSTVAKYLNVSQNTYSQYECGKIQYPVDILIQLSELYKTSVDYLLGLTDQRAPYPRKRI